MSYSKNLQKATVWICFQELYVVFIFKFTIPCHITGSVQAIFTPSNLPKIKIEEKTLKRKWQKCVAAVAVVVDAAVVVVTPIRRKWPEVKSEAYSSSSITTNVVVVVVVKI